ncbi:peptidase S8/S53 domain-containing protein [Xylariomycetidae sp. FL0641]|nr:peptidase S8/S53 domain-containing protein [Xylariomycetidae sp. FL0641]
MVRYGFLLSLVLSAASAVYGATEGLGKVKHLAGSYVVEFESSEDSAEFYRHINATASTRMHYDYALFKGASIQFEDLQTADAEAAKLGSLRGVKKVWPNRVYYLPEREVKWTGPGSGKGFEKISRRQSANDTYKPHVMTQVDKLQAKGVTGKGVKIGIIDTGVDYNHPALGGCFGPGCLVSYGADIVGDDYDGDNLPVPDADPYDACEGHGTHVAGIIAAQANSLGFVGAAPGATLGMFRVFGCGGGVANDVLIEAYMQAFEAGSDIITASIGGSSGWSEDPWSVAVSRIVAAGVPCTVSAGNDGSAGMFYASTASNGKNVTSVASIDNEVTPLLLVDSYFTVNSSARQTFGYALGEPGDWANISLAVWAPSLDTTDPAMACEPLPADTPDLSSSVVLIRRGSCTFVQKAANAAKYGARFVMFYNDVEAGTIGPSVSGVPGVRGVGMVTAAQGAAWVAALRAGSQLKLNLLDPETAPVSLDYQKNNVTGGFTSTYSTWNPTFEMDIKPQVASPGGDILSTYPIPLGTYAVLSGTSMACPLVAGIYALLSNVRGTLDPGLLESLVSATAKPQLFNDGNATYGALAPVMQIGGGIIQAYDAAYATTLLSRSSLAFNDTDNFVDTLNFTVTNTGSEEVSYELGHVGARTGYTFSDSIRPDLFPGLELTDEFAAMTFNVDKVTVPPGGDAMVAVTVTPPAIDGRRLPVYSGYVTLNGTDGSSLSLPYNGAVGSLHSTRVLDTGHLSTSFDGNLGPIKGNASFVLPKSNGTSHVAYPVAVAVLAFGSPQINIKLMSSSGNSTDLGHIAKSPYFYASRDPYVSSFDGMMADGTYAPPGRYTFRIEALHIFGNSSDAAEYDVVETVEFSVRYQ